MTTVTLRLLLDSGATILADMDEAQAVEIVVQWSQLHSVKVIEHSEDGVTTRHFVRLANIKGIGREVEETIDTV